MPISSKVLTAVLTLTILSLFGEARAAFNGSQERVRDEILKCGVEACSVVPQEILGERPSESVATAEEAPPAKLPVELRAIIR